jgi:hypothetical protein
MIVTGLRMGIKASSDNIPKDNNMLRDKVSLNLLCRPPIRHLPEADRDMRITLTRLPSEEVPVLARVWAGAIR